MTSATSPYNEPDPKSSRSTSIHGDTRTILHEMPHHEFLKFLEDASPEQLTLVAEHGVAAKRPETAFVELLRDALRTTPDSPAVWWESRRLMYNIVLFFVGLPALIVLPFKGAVLMGCIFGACVYGFFANVCYSFGSPIEQLMNLVALGKLPKSFREGLFAIGLAFSIVLTAVMELFAIAMVSSGLD